MIYLDSAATTFLKPPSVCRAVGKAMQTCASPGRGGYPAAQAAERTVYQTRALAAELFDCAPEDVCFTSCATEGLNIAIRTLVRPGDRVVISGLEHNAVTRPLHALDAAVVPVRAPLFAGKAWAEAFSEAVTPETACVVCTQVSNVFGAVLPIEEIAALCAGRGVALIVDASQAAGLLPVRLRAWQAAFVAMPGHKGLFGPQGTGLLLCGRMPEPLRFGGTGSQSASQAMPEFLPDRLEAGTANVPGIAGLGAGLEYVRSLDHTRVLAAERRMLRRAAEDLRRLGSEVWTGPDQAGVLSFRIPGVDPVEAAARFADRGIALRAGLHCAPLAHQTAGTFPDGTIRASVSSMTQPEDLLALVRTAKQLYF